jgi:hypothetical protein
MDSWSEACVLMAEKLCPQCPTPPPTCSGFCGGQSTGGCFCDFPTCCNFGDCCEDLPCFCGHTCFSGACPPGEFNGDEVIDGRDLGLLLLNWGPVKGKTCLYDIDHTGEVDGADLGILLLNWSKRCG